MTQRTREDILRTLQREPKERPEPEDALKRDVRREVAKTLDAPVIRMNPRYKRQVLRCDDCGGDCANGYEERMWGDSDGSYSESTFHCSDCLRKEGR